MTNQSGNEHVARDGLNRRQALGIGAGLGVLGAVGLEGTAHAADGLSADGRPVGDASLDPQTVTASTPGLYYSAIGIFDFSTRERGTTRVEAYSPPAGGSSSRPP